MGIEDISASAQNILASKYISPTCIEIVSVVVQIIPAGKNLLPGYKYENTCALAW